MQFKDLRFINNPRSILFNLVYLHGTEYIRAREGTAEIAFPSGTPFSVSMPGALWDGAPFKGILHPLSIYQAGEAWAILERSVCQRFQHDLPSLQIF